ncbi:hypothetical protein KR018_009361 [Drosophila ironensis]|nr:hypothetical protein KR018_009361 [Drosophila ironensis]
MSLEMIPYPQPPKIYLIAYEIAVAEDSAASLKPLVALKAEQLKVSGYITHTHCGLKVGGELEGDEEALNLMVQWLKEKARRKGQEEEEEEEGNASTEQPPQMAEPRFSKWKLQSRAKYDDFFCC